MPTKSNSLRLLMYALAALVAGGAYLLREHLGPAPSPRLHPTSIPKQGNSAYETLQGCRVLSDSGNDGGCIRVSHLGDEHTFLLYFVDCPETSDRNPERIEEQSLYFDGLSPAETISIGKEAKAFTLDLLEKHPFAIQTRWENVVKSDRHHAFVLIEHEPGKSEYLSEILARKGLARIETLGAPLPDGRSRAEFEEHLESLEKEARSNRAGAWSNRAK